ncbi:hypothetical protein [Anaerosolibacter sp.]|uniref:hypothetical protein n=1 Tax=Anaerosolibacter sp. TaxID=1872527 RepID=UPI0039F1105E
MDLSILKEFCSPYYAHKDMVHNLSHIERVLKYALSIMDKGDYDVNRDILVYAAYFHGFIYHHETEIILWLRKQHLSPDEVDRIIKVAWESQRNSIPETIEGRIVPDAHMLEGGKTFLVVKSLITGSLRGQTLEETIQYMEDNLIDKGQCYLPEIAEIYREQQRFSREFIEDLKEGLMLGT